MTVHDDALSERECWELLATVSVGPLALSVRALPVILPVQYYLDGRKLAVCLGHHALPERALDDTIIAFAADSIDPVTRFGLVSPGPGPVGDPPRAPDRYRLRLARRLRSGRGDRTGRISGHRMHLCPFIGTLLAGGPKLSAT